MASQIFEILIKLISNTPENNFTCELYIGGLKKIEQNSMDITNKAANIIVATPGKLREMTNIKDFLNLKTLEILIMGLN